MISCQPGRQPLPPFLLPAAAVLACLLLVALPASANPPKSVEISYDQLTSDLSVTIDHPAGGISGHYIKEVSLTVNGNMVSDSFYTSQPADVFTYTYPLSLKPGDVVVATATCSITGTGSRTFIMPGPTVTAAETEEKAPVPAAIPLAALAAALAFRRKG